MIRHHTATLLALSTAIGLVEGASAADYEPLGGDFLLSAPEIAPVEIGTGWYIRGDAAYEFDEDIDGSGTVSSPFGTAGFQHRDFGLDDGFGGGIGVGYTFTEYLRADVTARYSRFDARGEAEFGTGCFPFASNCSTAFESDVASIDLMANAYADLGTFAGFTPYVGGGLGAVNIDYDDLEGELCVSGGCAPIDLDGRDSWRFAYALNAGIAYDVSSNLAIDVGYRFLDVDGGEIYSGAPEVSILELGFTGEDDGFQRHTITAGLRYSLW